jgi:hypothetical protein
LLAPAFSFEVEVSFHLCRVGDFQFNFRTMQAHKWREVWDPNSWRIQGPGGSPRSRKEEIVNRFLLKETEEGLSLVLLDVIKKEVSLPLSTILKVDDYEEVLKVWTDWVFERDVLRG